MTAEMITANGVSEPVTYQNGGLKSSNPNNPGKKSKESDRRRRRRKQKKNNKQLKEDPKGGEDSDAGDYEAKENENPQQAMENIEVEYVPEKAEVGDEWVEDFKKVFEKFTFNEATGTQDSDKKDEAVVDAMDKKKADTDSDEEELDNQQKDKGLSNKKKKLQRRMKIAELKQLCSKPDVVEYMDLKRQ